MGYERRAVAEAVTGDGRTFSGHTAVYNSPTYIGPAKRGFYEQVAPGAFDKLLKSGTNVRSVFNHDPNMLLGTTQAGTLRLTSDERGLHQETDLPDTTTGRDVGELVRRGDITGQSFQFAVTRDQWAAMPGGHGELRTILEVGELIDVGPVTFPAYGDTSASMRSVLTARNETRDGAAVGAMAKATDAAIDAATVALAGGNVAQALDLLAAASVAIDQASYGLWSVDTDLLTSMGLPDICALVAAVDAAVDAVTASLESGSTDPTPMQAANATVDELLAAMRLDDPDDDAAASGEPETSGAENEDRANAPVSIDAGRLRLARFPRGDG